jgi:uncharacterized protein YndB with AHSA1/START domain
MPAVAIERKGVSFRLERRFKKARDAVFRAWTDPEALRLWWCPAGWTAAEIEVDLRVGGAFRIGMRRCDDGTLVYVCGSFLEVNPPERLAYTWRWANAFDGMPETRITVQFISTGPDTIISLTHEDLPEIPVCLRHRAGWMAALDRLEGV